MRYPSGLSEGQRQNSAFQIFLLSFSNTPYIRLHSKSFRRLKDKTQVFMSPEGDHYRTRLTHTLEVSQNARTIAKALRMNEDLVEAIALGHDLGHTPFGHAGERALMKYVLTASATASRAYGPWICLKKEARGLILP